MTKLRTIIVTLLAALTLATATAPAAQAQPNTGSRTECIPGTEKTVTEAETITYKGRHIITITKKTRYVCGTDGKWHQVPA